HFSLLVNCLESYLPRVHSNVQNASLGHRGEGGGLAHTPILKEKQRRNTQRKIPLIRMFFLMSKKNFLTFKKKILSYKKIFLMK
ncbi:MAG: hypothetical protein MJA29_11280, partial [Candidatus Omnitrophica bacterium]|nr:hypothetical protein [Candidatus Omnitrophota bacterium]